MLFGAPFICINYVAGYLFKKADNAFKYIIIVMLIIYLLPYLVGGIYAWITGNDASGLINAVSYISPPALLMQSVQGIMGQSFTGNDDDSESLFLRIRPQLIAMVC